MQEGEYNTKEDAMKRGQYLTKSSGMPFEVREKIEKKKEMPKEDSTTASEDIEKRRDIIKKNSRNIDQLRRINQSKRDIPFNLEKLIFKFLPGKMLKDITFNKIEEERTFNPKTYEDYITKYKNGYVFYDLDKDGSQDVAVRFDEGQNRPATDIIVSEILDYKLVTGIETMGDIGTLHEIAYEDIDKDGILEKKVEFTYNKYGQVLISRRDMDNYPYPRIKSNSDKMPHQKTFKERIFDNIDNLRIFMRWDLKEYVSKDEGGAIFYDLDKDGADDLVAYFKLGRLDRASFLSVISNSNPTEKDNIPDILYSDEDNNGVMETKTIDPYKKNR